MGTANRTLKIRIDNGPEIDGVLNIDVEQIDVTVMTANVDYIQTDNGVRRLAKIAGVGPLGYRKTAVRV